MKKIALLTFIFSLTLLTTTYAQFLKNIKDQSVERSKDVVQNKTTEKAMVKTAEGMDKILNFNPKEAIKGEETYEEYDLLKPAYGFSLHYQMKLIANGKATITDYLFQPNAGYYGVSSGQETDKLTIFDEEYFFTFSGTGKNKAVKSSKPSEKKKDDDTFNFRNTMASSELPAKNLMGSECLGFQLKTSDRTVDYYVMTEVPAAIPAAIWTNLNVGLPRPVLQQLMTENRGLIVSVEMRNNANNARIFQLECTELNPIDYEFETEGYTIR